MLTVTTICHHPKRQAWSNFVPIPQNRQITAAGILTLWPQRCPRRSYIILARELTNGIPKVKLKLCLGSRHQDGSHVEGAG